MTRTITTSLNSVRRRHRRAAFTLIEMLVVLTLSVLLLASISTAIAALLRAQGRLEDDLRHAAQLSRFDSQLRSDAHRAHSVEQPDQATVVFHLPTQRVEYTSEPTRIVRSLRQDDSILHREVFPLAAKTTVAWTIAAAEGAPLSRPILSATVTYEPADPTQSSAIDQIDAVVGLHGRPAE
jgi:type II secretory pathway pseudopilin PulG